MNSSHRTLREIALLSLGKEHLSASSGELARRLNLSQQTASRHLIELAREGAIRRELSGRKQRITITEKGLAVLREEFVALARIFEEAASYAIEGTLVSGLGDGKYYISLKGYSEPLDLALGWKPYPGTLNLDIGRSVKELLCDIPVRGTRIPGFVLDSRSYGDITVYHGYIHSTPVALVMPKRGGHGQVAEFVSPYHLRQSMALKDGDAVKVNLVRE